MQRPNLFIIGAAKCGTSALHEWLDSHAEISMSSVKEPGYFLEQHNRHPAIRQNARTEEAQLARYLGLFDNQNGPQKYWGASSTGYTQYPRHRGVPERIQQFCPNARLIYIIRDPIDRTISHYWWNVRFEGETRGLLQAVMEDCRYTDVSYYAMQLKVWLKHFDQESIYTTTLEELHNEPKKSLVDLEYWLEVSPSAGAPVLPNANATPPVIVAPRSRMLENLRFSRFWSTAGPLVPGRLRRIARRLNSRLYSRSKSEEEAVEEHLRPIQQAQTEELGELLGRDFAHWRRLFRKTATRVSTLT
jgi:hypothetical protein